MMQGGCQRRALLLSLFFLFLAGREILALEASEVAVIANRAVPESLDLATYYMQQRAIPRVNLLTVETVAMEICDRQEYELRIRRPLLRQLDRLRKTHRIRCLVTMYGMPLKISDDREGLAGMQHTRAAVDSELSLVLAGDYPLAGWQRNPYFLGFQGQESELDKDTVLMVARLDAPDPATVRRMIDDSLKAEKAGLRGLACLDGRWPRSAEKGDLDGYALYDLSIHRLAAYPLLRSRMEVREDDRPELFGEGACPSTALYCGWYSPRPKVESFTLVPGAVGYHIVSNSCESLKTAADRYWCGALLGRGAAATVGAVYEPYVQGFPVPELFFSHLVEGYLSLAESYLVSLPYLSWQITLLGDPLYLPFSPLDDKNLLERGQEGT